MEALPPASTRFLYRPRPVRVRADAAGTPLAVGPLAVESVREAWLVEDGWWTLKPLRRRYYELVLANGSNAVVFFDLVARRWQSQKGT